MYKRMLRAVAAIVIGLTAGLVALPGASFAATGLDSEYVTFASDGSYLRARPTGDWRVGDCSMLANAQGGSYVQVGRPDAVGRTSVDWYSVTSTVASPTDVYLIRVQLLTAFGTKIVETLWLRSADMTRVNTVYTKLSYQYVNFDPTFFSLITTVRMSATC